MRTLFPPGCILMSLSGLVALVIAIVDYFTMLSGISHAPGTLLVGGASLLIWVAALALIFPAVARTWVRPLLLVLLGLGILGTAVAAWFLESWGILICMLVAALGWLIELAWHPMPEVAA